MTLTNRVIRMMLKGKVGQFVTTFQNLQLVSLYESASICVILIPEHSFFKLCYIWPSGFDHTSSSHHNPVEDNLVRLAHQSFMNSTLESRGLSNRKSRRKFSSIGRSWASWGHSYLFEQFSAWGDIFLFWRISGWNRLLSTSRISIFPSLLSSYAWWQRPYLLCCSTLSLSIE